MIHEIKSSDWPAFCRKVTEQQADAMVKLETIEPNGVKTEQFANATFQSLVFDQTDACNDVITLRLRNTREMVHEILDPVQITLHPSGGIVDFNRLQIKAENGISIITMHPAIHMQLLNDFKSK